MSDDEEYAVEAILKHMLFDDATMDPEIPFRVPVDMDRKRYHSAYVYLIKWENYPEESNTWEPEEMFTSGNLILEDYKRREGLPPGHSKIWHHSLIHQMPLKASRLSCSASLLCSSANKKSTSKSVADESKKRMRSPLRRKEAKLESLERTKPHRTSSLLVESTDCGQAKRAKISDFNEAAARINADPSPKKDSFMDELNQMPTTSSQRKRVHSKSPPRAPKKAVAAIVEESAEARRERKKDVPVIRYHDDSSNLNCGIIQRELMIRRRWSSAERLSEFWKAKAMEHKRREMLDKINSAIYQQVLRIRQRNIEEKKKRDHVIVYMKEKKPGVFRVEKKFAALMMENQLPKKIKAPLLHSDVLFAAGKVKETAVTKKTPVPEKQLFRGIFNGFSEEDYHHVMKFMKSMNSETEVEIPVLGQIICAYLNKDADLLHQLLNSCEERSKIALKLLEVVPLRDHVAKDTDVLESNVMMLSNPEGQFCSGDDVTAATLHWKCRMIQVLLTLMTPHDYMKKLFARKLVHKAIAQSRRCQSLAYLSSGCSWNDGSTYDVEHGLEVDVNLWALLLKEDDVLYYFPWGFDPFSIAWSRQSGTTDEWKALDFTAALEFMAVEVSPKSINVINSMRSSLKKVCLIVDEDHLGACLGFSSFQCDSLTTPHVIRVTRFSGSKTIKRVVLSSHMVDDLIGLADVKPTLMESSRVRMVLGVFPFEAKLEQSSDDEGPTANPVSGGGFYFRPTIAPVAKITEASIRMRGSGVVVPLKHLDGGSSQAGYYVVERAHIGDILPGGVELVFKAFSHNGDGQSFAVQLFVIEETKLRHINNVD